MSTESEPLHPADLERLRALPNLRSLVLNGEVDLAALRGLGLRSLTLHRSGIDDAALASLADLPELRRLVIRGAHALTGTNLNRLRTLPLHTLELHQVPVTNHLVEVVATLDQLKHLVLDVSSGVDRPMIEEPGEGFSSVDMSPLGQLHRLESLVLSNIRVGDDALNAFRHLRQLRHLELIGADVTSAGVHALTRRATSLMSLHLYGTHVQDISFMEELQQLRRLELPYHFPAEALAPLRGHPSLRYLDTVQVRNGDLLLSIPHLRARGGYPDDVNRQLRERLDGFHTSAVDAYQNFDFNRYE